jgi:RNA polymerase-binding transcription factor DksA
LIEFDEDHSDELSLNEVYESKKNDNKKKSNNKYAKKYQQKPEVKERIKLQRESRAASKRIKKMDEDQHSICKKLGKTIAYSRRHPEYRFKCTHCEVSFSEKDQNYFFKKNHCPCCHIMMRQRKTVNQKRSTDYENFLKRIPDE